MNIDKEAKPRQKKKFLLSFGIIGGGLITDIIKEFYTEFKIVLTKLKRRS